VDAGAVDVADRRARGGPVCQVDDRRRDDVDGVTALDESTDELARRDDRAAECARRPPDGRCEQDPHR
jgi:hypothetical protein